MTDLIQQINKDAMNIQWIAPAWDDSLLENISTWFPGRSSFGADFSSGQPEPWVIGLSCFVAHSLSS